MNDDDFQYPEIGTEETPSGVGKALLWAFGTGCVAAIVVYAVFSIVAGRLL